jgi:prepilin-type N-terminal cleavage/methylation domain-containing protein
MLNRIRKNEKGFTIIEVLIVLAIAGMIMLVVFLAVPALQRNSRNTQRKADVAGILAAYNDYMSNNAGQLPATGATATTWAAPNLTIGTAGTSSQAKLGFYTTGIGGTAQGQVQQVNGPQAAVTAGSANDRVIVNVRATCAAGGATAAGSGRQVAIQYEIESGSNAFSPTCQEL